MKPGFGVNLLEERRPMCCIIFWNIPADKKWYVSFHDGGYGGPTVAAPYFIAVQLKTPHTLTHFTVTTSQDVLTRDPKAWSIQGSNTGKPNDWTDIYRCKATDRKSSPFRVHPRSETTLYTSFTSAKMAKSVSARDLKKLTKKLGDKVIKKADFARPKKNLHMVPFRVYLLLQRQHDTCGEPEQTAGLCAWPVGVFRNLHRQVRRHENGDEN